MVYLFSSLKLRLQMFSNFVKSKPLITCLSYIILMLSILKKTVKDESLRKIKDVSPGSWICLIEPTKSEIETVVSNLNLDRKNIIDALDEYEPTRIEKDENAIYVLIRIPVEDMKAVYTIPIGIILTSDYIITVTRKMNYAIDTILSRNKDIYTTQRINFMIHLFLLTSEAYELYLKRISKEIKRKKARIRDLSNNDIINIIKQEEILNDFISSFLPTVNVFEKVLSGKFIPLYRQDKDIIEDVLINSKQTLELCRSNIKTATNIREAYSTVLSNNLNKIIKLLTVFTIVLAIPTTIASLFGMNVVLPMQDNKSMFWYILLSVTLLTIILIVIFYKKRWI